MKITIPVLALTGGLVLTAIGSLPASAQSRSDVINDPRAVPYSWGVVMTDDDGPARSYSWQELDAAQSGSLGLAPAFATRAVRSNASAALDVWWELARPRGLEPLTS